MRASRNKFLAREHFSRAGLLVPEYFQVPAHSTAAEVRTVGSFPVRSEAPWIVSEPGCDSGR